MKNTLLQKLKSVHQTGGTPRPLHHFADGSAIVQPQSDLMLSKIRLVDAVAAGKNDRIETLLSLGRSPNGDEGDDHTPLVIAIAQGNLVAVKLLVKHGADVNLVRSDTTALIAATHRADVRILRYVYKLTSARTRQFRNASGTDAEAIAILLTDDQGNADLLDVFQSCAYAAVAISKKGAWGGRTKCNFDDASQAALGRCSKHSKTCKVYHKFRGKCFAIAHSSGGGWGSSVDYTAVSAEYRALAKCLSLNKSCKLSKETWCP